MNRIAALADILPPAAPPPLPPAAWWQLPMVGLAAALVLFAVVWVLLWRRRSRRWRNLRAAALHAMQDGMHPPQAATRLAAGLRAALPEAAWPPVLRQRLEALRFAPLPAQEAQTELHRLAAHIAAASRLAVRAAWWRPDLPQTVFTGALHAAASPHATPPTAPIAAREQP
jgi:hypothetical protein